MSETNVMASPQPSPAEPIAEIVEKYRPLCRRSANVSFGLKLATLAVVACVGVWLTLSVALWVRIIGTLLVGVMFAHALELQHETLHNIGFRRRWANVVAGTALGVPMLVSYAAYQVAHLRHHRDLGTPDNKEFFDYGDQYGTGHRSPLLSALSWMYRLSMVAHYAQFLRTLSRVLTGRPILGERPAIIRRIRRDYLIILAVLAAIAAVSAVTQSLVIVWSWIVPLMIVAAPAHALIELPEHFRCDTGTKDVLQNSRTISSNTFMAWLTNANNFHVEHHLLPNLPFSYLPQVHDEVGSTCRFYSRSYTTFFLALLRGTTEAAQ